MTPLRLGDSLLPLMNTDDARTPPEVPRLRRSLLGWYRREARDLPWRRTRDPYAVWISEVMLQQTTVATVIPYYERFLSRFPDLRSLAASDEEELLALWSGLGYYRRARNLRAAARIIVERHGGRFPEDPAAIQALPGIGRYTAGAIASNCFGKALPAVDTNAARVVARLYAIEEPQRAYGTRSKRPFGSGSRALSRTAAIWRIAEKLVPPEAPGDWTQALMELGATLCRPSSPDCGICPVAEQCLAFERGDLEPYSLARPRTAAVTVHASLVVVERGRGREQRILLVRRGADQLLGGLWELPGTLAEALAASAGGSAISEPDAQGKSIRRRIGRRNGEPAAQGKSIRRRIRTDRREPRRAVARALASSLGLEPTGLVRSEEVRHTVTHRRLRIAVWTAAAPAIGSIPRPLRTSRGQNHLWANPRALAALPLGAASRKALSALPART